MHYRGRTTQAGGLGPVSPDACLPRSGRRGSKGRPPRRKLGGRGARRDGQGEATRAQRRQPAQEPRKARAQHQGSKGIRAVFIHSLKAPRIWHLPVITALLLFLTFMKTFIFSTANFKPFSNQPFLAMSRYDLLP